MLQFLNLLPKFRECPRVLVFALVDLRVIPLLRACSWILLSVARVELEKYGSLPCLVYPRPPVELCMLVQALAGLSSLLVVLVWGLCLQGRFPPVGLWWCVLLRPTLRFVLTSREMCFAWCLLLGIRCSRSCSYASTSNWNNIWSSLKSSRSCSMAGV